MGRLLLSGETGHPYTLGEMKKQREAIMKNWEATGLLDNLTDGKINIAEMMESQASHLLNETKPVETYSADTIPMMPLVRRVLSAIPEGCDIVAVAKPQEWYVYLLRCGDDSLYCGITNDVDKRLEAHRSGKGAKYTRGRLPLTLELSKVVGSKSEALKLEYKVKQKSKDKKIEFLRSS